MNPQDHHRRSVRLKGYDYTQSGAYFVTICSYQREEIFGEVVEGEMRLNPFGEIIREEWMKTAKIRSNVALHEDEFVIMPNHFHGILWIVETVGATRRVALLPNRVALPNRVVPTNPHTLISGSVGAILGQFKSITAKRINALRGTPGFSVWQRNYYFHKLLALFCFLRDPSCP